MRAASTWNDRTTVGVADPRTYAPAPHVCAYPAPRRRAYGFPCINEVCAPSWLPTECVPRPLSECLHPRASSSPGRSAASPPLPPPARSPPHLRGQVQRPYVGKIYLRFSSLSTILSPTTGRRQRRSDCPSAYRKSTAGDDVVARHDPLIAYGNPTAGDGARARRDPQIKSMPTADPGLSATSRREALEARIGTRPTLLTGAEEAKSATRRQFVVCSLCERGIFSRPLTFLHVTACLFKHPM